MPPSLRRRAQHHLPPPQHDEDLSDSDIDDSILQGRAVRQQQADESEVMGDELVALEGDMEGELEDDSLDEDALVDAQQANLPPPNLDPPPSYFREISTLASWTVSSSKPGNSIPQLRHPSPSLFWQSDGPQPHYLNIHFFKLVRIVGLRLYLDFEQDESYTPTRIQFLAGSGMNDLQEWGEMRLEAPRGWIWVDFSGVADIDSDSDDMFDSDDDEPNSDHENPLDEQLAITHNDQSSDSENAAPRRANPSSGRSTFALDTDPMHLDASITLTPQATPTTGYTTATTPADLRAPPSLARPTPRLPFTALSPNAVPGAPRPRTRRPRLPVLRAHLVQLKILENHQNGKDTHLRGLQIFALNDEADGRAGTGVGVGASEKGLGVGGGVGAKGLVVGRKREERWELRGGFGEGEIR